MRVRKNKKVLFVGLMTVLAVALTGCKVERGPNDTVDQATANNAYTYDGGTFEGGGALRQPQYEQFGVSSAADADDKFVLWPSGPGKLPRATYRLTVTPGPDPSRFNGSQFMEGRARVYGYHESNGKWKDLGGDRWLCSADAEGAVLIGIFGYPTCSVQVGFRLKDPDITGLRVDLSGGVDAPGYNVVGFAGTYAFKLQQET